MERLHRTLNSILAKTVDRNHRDWDSKLSYAMATYRASRHDSTGYTPNYFVLGRETRMPVDIIYGTHQDEEEATYDGYRTPKVAMTSTNEDMCRLICMLLKHEANTPLLSVQDTAISLNNAMDQHH